MKKTNLILSILFTYNNIFFIMSNLQGKILNWSSLGFNKTKGLKKITKNSIKSNLIYYSFLKNCFFHIKLIGLNKHKKILLKILKELNLSILTIYDETNFPHNGCKNKKLKRI
uniref:ribosomal protein S11 n=1 Tax=Griffithsia okiensis TaxID=291168 RepID=UPI002E784D76|nr:ribosomal protein S11 [Griffithsia okiensis]WQF69539.1 ribosomal protein S11 [Griffithsia okiensis]